MISQEILIPFTKIKINNEMSMKLNLTQNRKKYLLNSEPIKRFHRPVNKHFLMCARSP